MASLVLLLSLFVRLKIINQASSVNAASSDIIEGASSFHARCDNEFEEETHGGEGSTGAKTLCRFDLAGKDLLLGTPYLLQAPVITLLMMAALTSDACATWLWEATPPDKNPSKYSMIDKKKKKTTPFKRLAVDVGESVRGDCSPKLLRTIKIEKPILMQFNIEVYED